jgi:hypothetical protein
VPAKSVSSHSHVSQGRPAADVFRRLEDEGVTGVVTWAFAYTVGPNPTLDQKRRALEDYGNGAIAKVP